MTVSRDDIARMLAEMFLFDKEFWDRLWETANKEKVRELAIQLHRSIPSDAKISEVLLALRMLIFAVMAKAIDEHILTSLSEEKKD